MVRGGHLWGLDKLSRALAILILVFCRLELFPEGEGLPTSGKLQGALGQITVSLPHVDPAVLISSRFLNNESGT